MVRKELDSLICQLSLFERVFYKRWRLTPREIGNLKIDPKIKETLWGVSKPGFSDRYSPEKRKAYEKIATTMWSVFEENGIQEKGDRFKSFYKENFSGFDFVIHRRIFCLLTFCEEGLTDEGGINFIDALLSVGEENNYFGHGDRAKLTREILFWNPFGQADNRIESWLASLGEEAPVVQKKPTFDIMN